MDRLSASWRKLYLLVCNPGIGRLALIVLVAFPYGVHILHEMWAFLLFPLSSYVVTLCVDSAEIGIASIDFKGGLSLAGWLWKREP